MDCQYYFYWQWHSLNGKLFVVRDKCRLLLLRLLRISHTSGPNSQFTATFKATFHLSCPARCGNIIWDSYLCAAASGSKNTIFQRSEWVPFSLQHRITWLGQLNLCRNAKQFCFLWHIAIYGLTEITLWSLKKADGTYMARQAFVKIKWFLKSITDRKTTSRLTSFT
jgi:hypothetical protein